MLDEAHQYRGAKGIEMGMLIRRLKQRLQDGGRKDPFRCVATSATITTGDGPKDKRAVADFAQALFGERFLPQGVIFSTATPPAEDAQPNRYHTFLRALEGAFLIHRDGRDSVVLNRAREASDRGPHVPLELALCRECGQHYYVGRVSGGTLVEATRDPSREDFGATYFMPDDTGDAWLCRSCGRCGTRRPTCQCGAAIRVRECPSHQQHPDQLKNCAACGYSRGSVGDPVQEIVHGNDGPGTVIALALHQRLPGDRRKVLAFVDSRQDAAYFAWYAEDKYRTLRNRNLIYRAVSSAPVADEGLSIEDLHNRLYHVWGDAGLFRRGRTREHRRRDVLTAILREAFTVERRLSLSGVGLIQWSVALPGDPAVTEPMQEAPWGLSQAEASRLVAFLLDHMRAQRAMEPSTGFTAPPWGDLSDYPQTAYRLGRVNRKRNVRQWDSTGRTALQHVLRRLLGDGGGGDGSPHEIVAELLRQVWHALRQARTPPVLRRASGDGTFRLNGDLLRIRPLDREELLECDTCLSLHTMNIRGICLQNRCLGHLRPADPGRLTQSYNRVLYQDEDLPARFSSEEHTAQISPRLARERQAGFKEGRIHLLSSSTTFELGVDLGDLDVAFLRNVPPEPFNYTQRAGRAGRGDAPGLVVTYCRRNPHDLYHYQDPESRLLHARVHPPRLQLTNEKIITRHMVAVAMAGFFRAHPAAFKTIKDFVGGDFGNPGGTRRLRAHCTGNEPLRQMLRSIVPGDMYAELGLNSGAWVERIAGPGSRLNRAEQEVSAHYVELDQLRQTHAEARAYSPAEVLERRLGTIARTPTLTFYSRKAVIPKYGFPVDVVELQVRSTDRHAQDVSLQRNLGQAVAEYAPTSKVIANKLAWESAGVRILPGKALAMRHYSGSGALDFQRWDEGGGPSEGQGQERRHADGKYLIPEFGFVTHLHRKPVEPKGRGLRLFTTRPYFGDFNRLPETRTTLGIGVTQATPGTLVILCSGRRGEGFHICLDCGAGFVTRKSTHESPLGIQCSGTLDRYSLGHELATDIVRLQFPALSDEWAAYSVAYAVLLGAADVLGVPDTDLNVTITKRGVEHPAVILYDNVPGGAGLVAQFKRQRVLKETLAHALERVQGGCGCTVSCYGCLRSYRNQFAHHELNRETAHGVLSDIVARF